VWRHLAATRDDMSIEPSSLARELMTAYSECRTDVAPAGEVWSATVEGIDLVPLTLRVGP